MEKFEQVLHEHGHDITKSLLDIATAGVKSFLISLLLLVGKGLAIRFQVVKLVQSTDYKSPLPNVRQQLLPFSLGPPPLAIVGEGANNDSSGKISPRRVLVPDLNGGVGQSPLQEVVNVVSHLRPHFSFWS